MRLFIRKLFSCPEILLDIWSRESKRAFRWQLCPLMSLPFWFLCTADILFFEPSQLSVTSCWWRHYDQNLPVDVCLVCWVLQTATSPVFFFVPIITALDQLWEGFWSFLLVFWILLFVLLAEATKTNTMITTVEQQCGQLSSTNSPLEVIHVKYENSIQSQRVPPVLVSLYRFCFAQGQYTTQNSFCAHNWINAGTLVKNRWF